MNNDNDYAASGFDSFLTRPIDGMSQMNLDSPAPQAQAIRYDDKQVSGFVGDTIQVGKIRIDGVKGRLSVFDDTGNEVIRIGELDD